MSLSRAETRLSRQSRRRRSSRSCSRLWTTRLAWAWLKVWRDRAGTSPACRCSRPNSLASDSNYCARLCPVCAGWRSWPMLTYPTSQEVGGIQATAGTLGLDVAAFEIRRAEDIAPAFEALKSRAQALYVVGDALVITHRVRINTLALAARLPTIYNIREYVEAGGLMSYGPNIPDLFRRAV